MNTHHIHPYTPENTPQDEVLWDSMRNGDREAFTSIYQTHVDALYSYGMNFTRDSFLVKESIQDLFVNIWNKRTTLGKTNNIRFYLLRSLRRKLSQHYKDQKKWDSGQSEKNEISNLLGKKAFEKFARQPETDSEVTQKLNKALAKLPARQKEALYHIYYEELSYEEVAALMNVSIKTAYNLAWRGIEALRKGLTRNFLFSSLIVSAFQAVSNFFE